MAAKGGGGWRRDRRGQRGVIAAPEATEASWIWMTKMHAVKGGCKHKDGPIFWLQVQLLNSYISIEMLLLINKTPQISAKSNHMDNAVVIVVSSSFAALLMLSIAFANVLDPMGTFVATWINPESFATEVGLAVPLLLPSLIYKKIVPSITKLLGFNRAKTTAAIAIGSLIPMGIYIKGCLDSTTASGTRAAAFMAPMPSFQWSILLLFPY